MNNRVLEFKRKYVDIPDGEFEKAFKDLLDNFTSDDQFIFKDGTERVEIIEKLIIASKEIDFAIIPYASITTIIFSHDESEDVNNIMELGTFLKECYKTFYEEIIIDDDMLQKYEPQLIVVAKFIEHLELAVNQKNSLYKQQDDDLKKHRRAIVRMNRTLSSYEKTLESNRIELQKSQDDIIKTKNDFKSYENSINDINKNYENMLSQYISILGIFAAILMTAFGAIQGFTAIYTKDNDFSLADSILIASIGFMGVLLLLFYLMSSISKMTGKSLNSAYGVRWYNKHPTLINSFIILSTISLTCIAYKVSFNPPVLSWWGIVYIVPILYFAGMGFYFNTKHPEEKNRRDNNNQK